MLELRRTPRRLLLLALDWTKPKDPPISLGQASIRANLESNNIPVIAKTWGVNNPEFSTKEVINFVLDHAEPDVDLAIGAYVWNEMATQEILKGVRKDFPGRIILGGPQISYVKKGLELFYPTADIFIRGYSEHAIAELMLLDLHAKKHIKGLHYANETDKGEIAKSDLESLPSPFLTDWIEPQTFIRWETQRGCPFRCAFCQYREPKPLKNRFFDLDRVTKEADWILRHKIIRDIHVVDATFNSGPNYLHILKTLSEGKYNGKIALQTRIEMITPEFLVAVKKLNETATTILEFGLQTIHPDEQKIIDRPTNMKKVSRLLKEVIDLGIETEISLIFGLPAQTVSSFEKSVQFCLDHNIPVIRAFPLMLFRGTPLHDNKEKLGLVELNEIAHQDIDRIQDDMPHVVSSPSFTYQDWKIMADVAADLEVRSQAHSAKRNVPFLSSYKSSGLLKHHGSFLKEEHKRKGESSAENIIGSGPPICHRKT